MRLGLAIGLVLLAGAGPAAAPLRIVAAEPVYGSIAGAIAGDHATISSVLRRPAADPHAFEPPASVAGEVASADAVLLNGAGYDSWMERLTASLPRARVVTAAAFAPSPDGGNPHLWFDLDVLRGVARRLAAIMRLRDPGGAADYAAREQAFEARLQALASRESALRARFGGTPVAATEPVADGLLRALGLDLREQGFARDTMNGTEPGAGAIAAFEDDLRSRRVRLLIVNAQATNPQADRMRGLATASHVPVVAIGETLPAGLDAPGWAGAALDAIERALAPR